MSEERLLDEKEAAKIMNVSLSTMRLWRRKGGGPNWIKLGRLVRYRELHLREFIASCVVK